MPIYQSSNQECWRSTTIADDTVSEIRVPQWCGKRHRNWCCYQGHPNLWCVLLLTVLSPTMQLTRTAAVVNKATTNGAIPTAVLLYSYTLVLLYSCTLVFLYSCTLVLLYSCTLVLLYPCTLVPMYSCTLVLLYPYTLVPLYSCALVPLYHCTLTISQSHTCLPSHPHTLVTSSYPCILFINAIKIYNCNVYITCTSTNPITWVGLMWYCMQESVLKLNWGNNWLTNTGWILKPEKCFHRLISFE